MEIYLKIYIFIIANKPKYLFVLFHIWRVFLWPKQNINFSIHFTKNENVFLYKQKSYKDCDSKWLTIMGYHVRK